METELDQGHDGEDLEPIGRRGKGLEIGGILWQKERSPHQLAKVHSEMKGERLLEPEKCMRIDT